MKTILLLGFFSLAVSDMAQAQAKNPKYVYDQEKGVILFRPTGEEWSCKKPEEGDSVFFSGTAAMVYHRLDDCAVQVLVSQNQNIVSSSTLKERAVGQIKAYEGEGRKVVTKLNVARKFPGAGSPKAQYVEVTINDKILRQYFFADKKNQKHLVIVTITGDKETYKKHQRKILWVLAKMRTEKVKKR